ncbi:hypothetical protein MHZ36_13940 [Staphylococcus sp. ACRSN]|uniref:hypothetical protein n=1 Tax=Staphylococcus sp. ACRSN TaxID=2918214 RepID=UPI001EF37A07|nr:hypothetical protein [Staphylococcus sp. ACRSN]MCG7340360.1 hypothetical protein [Staphylococcus sp. ACRSN]
MWKLKKFDTSTSFKEVDDIANEFLKCNNIKDFQIVGYQTSWSEMYEDYTTHILIKYWEDSESDMEASVVTKETIGDYLIAWLDGEDIQTKTFKNIKLENAINWTVRAHYIYSLKEDGRIGALIWIKDTGVLK